MQTHAPTYHRNPWSSNRTRASRHHLCVASARRGSCPWGLKPMTLLRQADASQQRGNQNSGGIITVPRGASEWALIFDLDCQGFPLCVQCFGRSHGGEDTITWSRYVSVRGVQVLLRHCSDAHVWSLFESSTGRIILGRCRNGHVCKGRQRTLTG